MSNTKWFYVNIKDAPYVHELDVGKVTKKQIYLIGRPMVTEYRLMISRSDPRVHETKSSAYEYAKRVLNEDIEELEKDIERLRARLTIVNKGV